VPLARARVWRCYICHGPVTRMSQTAGEGERSEDGRSAPLSLHGSIFARRPGRIWFRLFFEVVRKQKKTAPPVTPGAVIPVGYCLRRPEAWAVVPKFTGWQ